MTVTWPWPLGGVPVTVTRTRLEGPGLLVLQRFEHVQPRGAPRGRIAATMPTMTARIAKMISDESGTS